MLHEINNIYFRTKNPKLDRKLDRNLRILETDGRGLTTNSETIVNLRIQNTFKHFQHKFGNQKCTENV